MRFLFDRAAVEGSFWPWSGGEAGVLERVTAELCGAQRRVTPVEIAFCFNAFGCMLLDMNKALVLALLLIPITPAVARGASGFTLVNGTSGALTNVSIRRAGTNDWKPLGAAPSAGARGTVRFSDPDCAFDIRANVAGAPVTWAGVNLCDVKSVTLNKDDSAGAWVDYDQ